MYKVDSGILFAEILTDDSNELTNDKKWEFTKCGLDLDIVTLFFELDGENDKHLENTVKVSTDNGDIMILNIAFDEFAKVILKHRKESNIKIYN